MADLDADWIDYDGVFFPAGSPILTAGNRGFRYADGLFETMLVRNGSICHVSYHFDRLSTGLHLLGFASSSSLAPGQLVSRVMRLCEKNGHMGLARVRLAVFRGEGGLFDPLEDTPHYVMESWPLSDEILDLNEEGLAIAVFPQGRKACDSFANLKTSNFLVYAMGARYARARRLDDCLVLNTAGRVADSCIANLFYTKGGVVYTPPLSEGCVAGVMRRFLLERLPVWGYTVIEKAVTPAELQSAEGVFLTNALRSLRWVGNFEGKNYVADMARDLHALLIAG
jgi:branched-chain amino acid aminotransferase